MVDHESPLAGSCPVNVHFACNSCGKCCYGHHIALTLGEAMRWASDGGPLMILAEAFLENGYGVPDVQRDHAQRRSLRVRCGETFAYVSVTFAAFNIGTCRHLTEDKRCGIYEHRPLVCRIYPIEINPHIQLRRDFKDCPPETWDESGPAIYRDGRMVSAELSRLIAQSRQADRDEIAIKAEICRRLGIDVAALKGDGFTTYRPDITSLLSTMRDVMSGGSVIPPDAQVWSLHVSRAELAGRLTEMSASVQPSLPAQGAFIAL
jgi:Fe-S-cluster containining protein